MIFLALQTNIIPNVSVDDCGPKTAEGCCIGKGESWCASLRECVSPSVKVCPGGGGSSSSGGKTSSSKGATTNNCPNGGTPGIQRTACEGGRYCGTGYKGNFYNDNDGNGVACCKCEKVSTPNPSTPKPTNPPPAATDPNSCSGPDSAAACRDLGVGAVVPNTCQCVRTNGLNCACVGLGNFPEGSRCSADTNCIAGTKCFNGVCSRNVVPIGGSCRYTNDCLPGSSCSDGVCKPIPESEKPENKIACGNGYCPVSNYMRCENNVCKSTNPNDDRYPEEDDDGSTAQNPEDDDEWGGTGYDVYTDDGLVKYEIIDCNWYSNTNAQVIFADGSAGVIRGVCYKGANCDLVPEGEKRSECNLRKNDAVGFFKAPARVTSQVDLAVNQTEVTDTSGDKCYFVKFGCGPSTVTNLLNEAGIPIDNPLKVLPSYNNFSCAKGTTIEENVRVLNEFGLSTGKKIEFGPNSDPRTNRDLIRALDNGNHLFFRADITTAEGRQFGHLSEIVGVVRDERGVVIDLEIRETYFCNDGSLNRDGNCGNVLWSQIRNHIGYEISDVVPVNVEDVTPPANLDK